MLTPGTDLIVGGVLSRYGAAQPIWGKASPAQYLPLEVLASMEKHTVITAAVTKIQILMTCEQNYPRQNQYNLLEDGE